MPNQSRIVGLGGVIRDADEEVHFAYCLNQLGERQPEVVEALALRKIMQICEDLDSNRVIFERDCLPIVNAVNADELLSSETASILFDRFDVHFMRRRRPNWRTIFAGRDENWVARV